GESPAGQFMVRSSRTDRSTRPEKEGLLQAVEAIATESGPYVTAHRTMMESFQGWTELADWFRNLGNRVRSEVDQPLGDKRVEPAEAADLFRVILTVELPRLGSLPNR